MPQRDSAKTHLATGLKVDSQKMKQKQFFVFFSFVDREHTFDVQYFILPFLFESDKKCA
jgi:hypothetical protein